MLLMDKIDHQYWALPVNDGSAIECTKTSYKLCASIPQKQHTFDGNEDAFYFLLSKIKHFR